MADSKLEPIYDRLHGVPQYHPVNAETFADWAMEAGDVVTVSRNGEAHSVPVHSSTLRWRGKQQITINSEGAREREAIAKMAKKKYGRGGSGVRNSAQMYNYEVNQEHLLYEVYDTQGRVSTLTVNVRGLYHEVYDTDGKFSTLQNTANGLYHEVYDTDGKFSTLQNTANGLYHEVYDTDGKFSTLQNTANGLYHEVYDTDGKFSTLQNTANGLYHEVYDTDGKFSTLQNTANGLYHEVYDTNGKFSTLQNTVNGLYHEVYDTDGKFSTLQNTANGLYHEVYDTNGKFSTLQDTADGLYHEVYDAGTGLKTVVETQAGQLNMVVSGTGSNTKIKPAAIQASIDSATGTSKISLSADHVEIDGDVIVNGLSSTDDIDCGSVTSHGTGTFDSLVVEAGGTISAPSITVTEFNDKDAESLIALSEISEGNNTWTLTDVGGGTTTIVKSGNDLIFTDSEGNTFTFSKAVTSLSGEWSNGTLTVTPLPQGSPVYTSVASVNFWSQPVQGTTLYYVSASTADQGAQTPDHRASKRIDMALDGNVVKLRSYSGSTADYILNSPTYDISTEISDATTAGQKSVTPSLSWQTDDGTYIRAANPYDSSKKAEWDEQVIHTSSGSGSSLVNYASLQTRVHGSGSSWTTRINKTLAIQNINNDSVKLVFNGSDAFSFTHGKYSAGWGAARTSTGDFPTTTNTNVSSITVKRPSATVDGTADSYTYGLHTEGRTLIQLKHDQTVVAQIANPYYYTTTEYNTYGTTQYNNASPNGTINIGTKITGTTYNVTISKTDGTTVASTKDFSTIYSDARSGYAKEPLSLTGSWFNNNYNYTIRANGVDTAYTGTINGPWFFYTSARGGTNWMLDRSAGPYIKISMASGDSPMNDTTWEIPESASTPSVVYQAMGTANTTDNLPAGTRHNESGISQFKRTIGVSNLLYVRIAVNSTSHVFYG